MAFSRRALLSMLPAALLLPRKAKAAGPEKRLLIVYVDGGWDTTYVFAPIFGSSSIDIDPYGTAATVDARPASNRATPLFRRFSCNAERTGTVGRANTTIGTSSGMPRNLMSQAPPRNSA